MKKVGRHNNAITIGGQTGSQASQAAPWDAGMNTAVTPASQKTTRGHEMLQGRQEKPVSVEPKFTTISGWSSMTGMSRSNIYRAISRGDLKAVKLGRATLPAAQVRVAA